MLQPEAEDSYFTWNFFDSYLQQKEYFSSYVFIDKIDHILKNNPTLRKEYKTKRKEDSSFRESEGTNYISYIKTALILKKLTMYFQYLSRLN